MSILREAVRIKYGPHSHIYLKTCSHSIVPPL